MATGVLVKLVVVADQSSSKSSALEGLTDHSSPRDNGRGTRFATQIVFRRAENSSITISIIPSSAADSKTERETSGFQDPPYDFTLRRRIITSPFQGPEGHRTLLKNFFDTC